MQRRVPISSSSDILRVVLSFLKDDVTLLAVNSVNRQYNTLTTDAVKEMKQKRDARIAADIAEIPVLKKTLAELQVNIEVPEQKTQAIYRNLLAENKSTLSDFLGNIRRGTVTSNNVALLLNAAKYFSFADPRMAGFLLITAIENGYVELANTMIESGADLNVIRSGATTALHVSISRNIPAVITKLLAKGVNSNPATPKKPLMAAVEKNQRETTCLLLKHGADATAKDEMGMTAAQVPNECGLIVAKFINKTSKKAGLFCSTNNPEKAIIFCTRNDGTMSPNTP